MAGTHGQAATPMTSSPSELQQQINQFWNERAASAQGQPHHVMAGDGPHQAWLAALRPLLPPPPADVLDVGTGTGFLALLLAELGYRVTGIDLSEGMLQDGRALAQERFPAGSGSGPVFRAGDAQEPPLPPASVDLVSNRDVTWTLLDPRRALRNWYTLLRPAGRVLAVHHRVMRVGQYTPYPETAAGRYHRQPGGEHQRSAFQRGAADTARGGWLFPACRRRGRCRATGARVRRRPAPEIHARCPRQRRQPALAEGAAGGPPSIPGARARCEY